MHANFDKIPSSVASPEVRDPLSVETTRRRVLKHHWGPATNGQDTAILLIGAGLIVVMILFAVAKIVAS